MEYLVGYCGTEGESKEKSGEMTRLMACRLDINDKGYLKRLDLPFVLSFSVAAIWRRTCLIAGFFTDDTGAN